MRERDLREILEGMMSNYLKGKIQYHQANIEILLRNPAGVGEHSDVMECIETELGKVAEYKEKLDVLEEVALHG